MSKELPDPGFPVEWRLSKFVVVCQDEIGFPIEMGMLDCKDKGFNLQLLPMLIEAVKRKWGSMVVRELCSTFKGIFTPTKAEQLAIEAVL